MTTSMPLVIHSKTSTLINPPIHTGESKVTHDMAHDAYKAPQPPAFPSILAKPITLLILFFFLLLKLNYEFLVKIK